MESNKQIEQGKWGQTQRWRAGWQVVMGRGEGVDGLSKKEKGLIDMDKSVVIAGMREYKGTKQ